MKQLKGEITFKVKANDSKEAWKIMDKIRETIEGINKVEDISYFGYCGEYEDE